MMSSKTKSCDLRPVCKSCDQLADVLVARKPSPTVPWFAYCDEHDPDPEEYGNKTTWAEKITIRRYDEETPDYSVYGRPGGENREGRIIHVESPSGNGIICDNDVSGRKRYNLSIGQPPEGVLCRQCISTSNWREDYNDKIVSGYLLELRRILKKMGQLRDRATFYIEYPEPDPKTNHMIAEEVLD